MEFIWVIVISVIAFVLLGIQVIADAATLMSVVLIIFGIIVFMGGSKKGEGLYNISLLSVYSAAIYSAIMYLYGIRDIINNGAGGFFDLLHCIIWGALGTGIIFELCFLSTFYQDWMDTIEQKKQIKWNIFVITPIMYGLLWILRKIFQY